ncbi:hypothetical protein [Kitasatospora kifunensis]|uniref:Uncharacterized protein n=1 Tax=Kitasatospora kifunensis TaxID=58351 RepID=A0A7W7R0U4_KITKI|nr:hypothetical protein [Kitasatospora kifunensis]MBB4923120.1 hypothetical protein [Kitasatospora kifunensis]
MDVTREAGESRPTGGDSRASWTWPANGPWSIRLTGGGARPALEVYEHGELIDVLVASSLSEDLLRGARRFDGGGWADGEGRADDTGWAGGTGGAAGFAWGRLSADGSAPTVAFTGARLRRSWRPAEVVEVGDDFWLAWAPGPLVDVLARRSDGGTERLRPGRAR